MYLYVGSIVAIMCIYITVLLDNCPSFGGGGGGGGRSRKSRSAPPHKSLRGGDPETGSVGSGFGTLRRAHIDRTKVSRTSFYLRVGALGELFALVDSLSKFTPSNLFHTEVANLILTLIVEIKLHIHLA